MSDENLPATRAPLAATGGAVTAIIPRDIDQMFRLANAMHISGLSPSTLKSPEQVMIAIMAGAELGLPPFQSVQSFAVINGRPTLYGDGLLAVVRSNGFRVREWREGEGEGMVAKCEVTRPDNGETAHGEFSVTDAKRASLWGKAGPWQQYPKRMLTMRARAFALRDGAADVLRGFQIREEVEDYSNDPATVVDVPRTSGLAARLAEQQSDPAAILAQPTGFNAETVAAETGEPKPKGGRRKASTPPPSNDTAQSGEPVTASQEAQDGGTREMMDAGTGEVVEVVVEKSVSQIQTDAPTDDFPGDRPVTQLGDRQATEEGEQSGAETLQSQATSDDSPASDGAPYTEMAEAMTNAAHWLAEKQVLKTYAKTEHWESPQFRRATLQAAWFRFKHLQDEGLEETETFSDATLFQIYLEFGTKSAAEIDAVWPTFYRGVYKKLGDTDQKKTNDIRTRRKAELGA